MKGGKSQSSKQQTKLFKIMIKLVRYMMTDLNYRGRGFTEVCKDIGDILDISEK